MTLGCGATSHGDSACRATGCEVGKDEKKMSVTDTSNRQQESNANSTVRMAAEKVEPEGLQKAFSMGEMLPWKRINFEVEHVGVDRIVLRPVSTTSSFQK